MRKFTVALLLTLVLSSFAVGQASDPFAGLELKIAYNFDFWPEDDPTIGTELDEYSFFTSSPEAGYSTMYIGTKEAAYKDEGEVMGLGFRHQSILESSGERNYVAFYLAQRHERNPNAFDTFENAKYFTFFVDTTNYERTLEMYPIIYEQDYDEDGNEAGESCMAIGDRSDYYIETEAGFVIHQQSGANWITIPQNFRGRVYLPLDSYEPIWGTKDLNGKFDGLQVNRYMFSIVDIGENGEWIDFDEFGFMVPVQ